MLRNIAILGTVMGLAIAAPAQAQYVDLAAAARHQMLVEMQTMPGAATVATQGWIGEEQRVRVVAVRRPQPRAQDRAPRP